jgi:hypothetical protein
MSRTATISKTSKRIILDYSKNPSLDYKISSLQAQYGGLSRVEITKLAVIEFFKNHADNKVIDLTDDEETSLEEMMGKGFEDKYTMNQGEISKAFFERLIGDPKV